eukprot:gene7513-8347_t
MSSPAPINEVLSEEGSKSAVHHHESEELVVDDIDIKLSAKRFLVLFIFSMITMANAAIWITLSSVSNVVTAYYSIQYAAVNWLSMSYLLSYSIFAFPASIFLSKCGLKPCIVVAASLNGIGCCLRYAGVDQSQFVLLATGQVFAAVGSAFVLQVPPKLAAVWFGEHERVTATSVGVLMNLLGVSVGFIQPTLLVDDNNDAEIIYSGMNKLLLSQAVFCILFVFAALILVEEKPKQPPSRSEALRDESVSHCAHLTIKQSIRKLFMSKSFNLTTQAYGIMFGLMTCISTILNQAVKSEYAFVSDFQIGLLGFIATLCGSAATFLVGLFLDRRPKYKLTGVLLFILTTLSMAIFTITLLHMKNFSILFVVYCLLNIGMFPFFSSGLEQISEITYPVDQDISCSIPLIFGNIYGLVLTLLLGLLINKNMIQLSFLLMTAVFGLGLLCIVIAKVPMRRSLADHSVM